MFLKNNNSSPLNEIFSLTSFRFITAFIIFLFHCKLHFGFLVGIKLIDKFIGNGAVFMTGFFVLSGYIMCYVYQNKDFKQKREIFNFYIKRFAKIYPVYFLGTIAYFIFIIPETSYLVSDWIRIIINDLFLLQAFFSNMFKYGINGGTWSISVEAFFYFLFPLIMVLFVKKPRTLLSIGLFLSLIININVLTDIGVEQNIENYYANPIMRFNEFMIGISCYLLGSGGYLNKIPKIFRSSSFLFFLIFVLTVLEQSKGSYSYIGLHFFIIPLFGLLIFSFHNMSFGLMKNSKIMNYLGKISYSFYMWQFIVLNIGKYLKKTYDMDPYYIMILMLLLNIIISSLSYHLIEERFRRFIINKFALKEKK